MLIVTGTTIRKRPQGFAADYCAVCRGPETVHVVEHRRAPTLYWIPLSGGRAFELSTTCSRCGTRIPRPLGSYPAYAPAHAPWEEIAGLTNPRLRAWMVQRAEEEAAAIEGTSDPEVRMNLIAEVFTTLEPEAIRKQSSGWFESITAVLVVIWMGLTAAGFVLVHSGFAWGWNMLVGAGVLLVILIRRLTFGQNRERARIAEPRIASAIAPLNPTTDELTLVLVMLRRRGSTIAKGTTPDRLLHRIENMLDTAGAGDTSSTTG